MAGENLVKVLQIAGAALGIPAAAAGTFAAYQNYFSTEVTCQKLRNNIVATMERNLPPEPKRSLPRKAVDEFDKLCGEGDPDARTIFHAAATPEHSAPAANETARECHDCRCRPWPGCGRRAAGFVIPPLAAPVGARVRCSRCKRALRLGRVGPPAVGRLGAAFQWLYDLGHVSAAVGHGVERTNHAAGLVGAARGDQRSDQAAEPAAEWRLRARAVDARWHWPAVGRGRSGIMLVSLTEFAL